MRNQSEKLVKKYISNLSNYRITFNNYVFTITVTLLKKKHEKKSMKKKEGKGNKWGAGINCKEIW